MRYREKTCSRLSRGSVSIWRGSPPPARYYSVFPHPNKALLLHLIREMVMMTAAQEYRLGECRSLKKPSCYVLGVKTSQGRLDTHRIQGLQALKSQEACSSTSHSWYTPDSPRLRNATASCGENGFGITRGKLNRYPIGAFLGFQTPADHPR